MRIWNRQIIAGQKFIVCEGMNIFYDIIENSTHYYTIYYNDNIIAHLSKEDNIVTE